MSVGVDVNMSDGVGVVVDVSEGVGVGECGVTCVSVSIVEGCRGWKWRLHGCWWAAETDTGWRRRLV